MRALLDPATVACHEGLDSASIADIVETLLFLAADIRASSLTLLVSDKLFDHLSSENLFPLREAYEAVLQSESIYHVSGADLAKIALSMLQRAEVMEEVVADFDLADCSCGSDLRLESVCACHPAIDTATEGTLHTHGALSAVDSDRPALFLASPRRSPVRIETRLHYRSILTGQDELFENVSQHTFLSVAPSINESLSRIDAVRLVQDHGLRPEIIRVAIEATARQFNSTEAVPAWSLGPKFSSQLAAMGVLTNEGLLRRGLRACAEILLGAAKADCHWLRTDPGPGSPQIKRSGAAAWRQDVDREVHIHFWVFEDGEIQLASFAGHNYMQIPDPIADS